jgi:NifU-like protein involved in Fe-S cluster formation
MPARVKCALLAWHTLDDMIEKNKLNGTAEINACH